MVRPRRRPPAVSENPPVRGPELSQSEDSGSQQFRQLYTLIRRRGNSRCSQQEDGYRPPKSGKLRRDGEFVRGTASDPLRKAYTALRAEGIDPIRYLTILYSHLGGTAEPLPVPAQLLSDRMKGYYQQVIKNAEKTVLWQLKLHIATGRAKVLQAYDMYIDESVPEAERMDQAVVYVLLDKTVCLSPLISYCMAHGMRGERAADLLSRFECEAVLQFRCHPEIYAKWLGPKLPVGFVETVDQRLRHHCQRLGVD